MNIDSYPFYAYPSGDFLDSVTYCSRFPNPFDEQWNVRQSVYQNERYCTIVKNYSGALYWEIMKAVLGMEDGDFVIGEGFGIEGECSGELVFNTLMSGYMEALSDPSYYGQILMFTFPLIGNYGADTQNMQIPM